MPHDNLNCADNLTGVLPINNVNYFFMNNMLYMNVKRLMTLRLAVLSMPSVFMFHTFQNIDFMFTNWHIKFSDPYYFLVLLNMPLCVELSVYIVINCPNVHYTCQCNFKPKSKNIGLSKVCPWTNLCSMIYLFIQCKDGKKSLSYL